MCAGLAASRCAMQKSRRSAGTCAGLAATLSALTLGSLRRQALRRVGLTRWFSSIVMRCAGVERAVDQIGSCVEGQGGRRGPGGVPQMLAIAGSGVYSTIGHKTKGPYLCMAAHSDDPIPKFRN